MTRRNHQSCKVAPIYHDTHKLAIISISPASPNDICRARIPDKAESVGFGSRSTLPLSGTFGMGANVRRIQIFDPQALTTFPQSIAVDHSDASLSGT